jgi:hypothetical protein
MPRDIPVVFPPARPVLWKRLEQSEGSALKEITNSQPCKP